MNTIEQVSYFKSKRHNVGVDIVKSYVATEEEFKTILNFELALRKERNKLRNAKDINKDIAIAEAEIGKMTNYNTVKYDYYYNAIVKDEAELNELSILNNLISDPLTKVRIYNLINYANKLTKSNKEAKQIINVYIKTAKSRGINGGFYKYFDENANLRKENLLDFSNYLKEMFSKEDDKYFKKITGIFYTEEDYKEAVDKQYELIENEEKRLLETKIMNTIKSPEKPSIKNILFSVYLDENFNLYPYAIKYDRKQVLDDIEKKHGIEIRKKAAIQYDELYVKRELKIVTSINASNDDKEQLQYLINNKTYLNMIIDTIYSKEYKDLLFVDEKRELILSKFLDINEDANIIVSTNCSNLLIFPYESFVYDEITKINEETTNHFSDIKNGIFAKFKSLQTNLINELKVNNGDATHMIMDRKNGYEQMRICKDLKLFRLGARASKLCYVTIPINDDNRELLKDKYNLENNFRIIAVLGFGNVDYTKSEEDFYKRVKKQAIANEKHYEKIKELFGIKFNDDTFKKACDLIETSNLQLINNFDYNYLNIDVEQKTHR